MSDADNEALAYHSGPPRPGKLEIRATKPMTTQLDLSLAYSPGVAVPCLEIQKDPNKAFDYTVRGNLVAVVTNGTAVLGLGNLGPLAAKPVMEGKAVLFKRFADIDVFDLEVEGDPETFITVVKALEPTFGGINLEDIRAPEAFYIEERLRAEMSIPVFHDDQHGTAIITGAALINAAMLAEKALEDIQVVMIGAGAAAIAVGNLFKALGVKPEHILMADEHGVLTEDRAADMDKYKRTFARQTDRRTLTEALVGADVMVGLSVGNIVTPEMVKPMADRPIIFALANPTPEIAWLKVMAVRPDAIMATGRSDFPNQVNNVLGFPFIFRGALDVRATTINEAMKIAAVRAIAALAREPVPASVGRAYGGAHFEFGPKYIIPKPFDPRVLGWVAPAVAKAALDSGVAQRTIDDWDAYRVRLERMMDPGRGLMREIIDQARRDPKRIVLPESYDVRVLKAATVLKREGIAHPVLIGDKQQLAAIASEAGMSIDDIETISPPKHPSFDAFVERYAEQYKRQGITRPLAKRHMRGSSVFSMMMVSEGAADCAVVGATKPYVEAIRPALRIIGTKGRACGMYIVLTRDRTLFFADTTVTIDPTAEQLAEITLEVVARVKSFDITPRVAMLSFANFGSVRHRDSEKMALAKELVSETLPDLMIEGEVQVDLAVDMKLRAEMYPWSALSEPANVFIFPNLASANIAYKMLHQMGGASLFGPILLGMRRPVHVLALNVDASDIVNLSAYAVVSAQQAAKAEAR
ncbi:MAG: malate dehydrogenase (oxaloacetate-decarboxylating)(NADP+) [Myxococcota bacterium]|jgi:malate dehydrogenase (oxaloacetate-decarboxylating)(NADP+)